MSRKSKPRTAADLQSELERGPAYLKMRTEREIARLEREAARKLEQVGLVQELKTVNVNVSSVWDLVNTSSAYVAALPILLKHLQRPYSPRTREGIARSLAVRESRFAWDVLVSEYEALSDKTDHNVKAAVALAISASATPDVASRLVALAKDRRHGASRLMLLRGLKRLQSFSGNVIEDLRYDTDLAKEIASWSKR